MKKRLKTKGWTNERREKQRVRCVNQNPSHYSTGPKTDNGKLISAQNALTHGANTAAMMALSNALWEQSQYTQKIMDMPVHPRQKKT